MHCACNANQLEIILSITLKIVIVKVNKHGKNPLYCQCILI